MTELSKYDNYFFQNMRDFMEDDEHHGLLSCEWNGNFKSREDYRKLEIFVTLTYKNVKVRLTNPF